MSINLNYIAKELGISASTVSRVVNNKNNVNEKTREKVLKSLEKYDYTPNLIARSLQSKNTYTIGIIIPDVTENFFGNIIHAISNVMEKYNYGVLLCDTNENAVKEGQYLKYLYEQRISGIILATVGDNISILEKYNKNNIPVVFIDNYTKSAEYCDSVFINNIKAGEIGTEHLIKKGCRKIGIICGKKSEFTGYTRLNGYLNALKNNFIEPNETIIKYGDYKEESGYQLMCELLDSDHKIDGIFITSSKMTFGAIKALRDRHIRFPDDINLVGFDVYDPYNLIYPGITSVIQLDNEIGTKAAELLIKRLKRSMDDNSGEISKLILSPSLLIKESC